ncbi:MAG: fatty acid desaturase [Synechocystis sp.]|nr:fatty acid desaturase [Synechocystis sp.]
MLINFYTPHQRKASVSPPLGVRDQIYEATPNWPWLQELITHITGCPYTGQKALFWLTPSHYIVGYSLAFFGGLALSAAAFLKGFYGLVPMGWLLTLGGVAGYQLGLIHNASHLKVLKGKTQNLWLARILAVLILMGDAVLYFSGHRLHHAPKTHQTAVDNTIKALFDDLGFQPGQPVADYWCNLLQLLNPWFLLKFVIGNRFWNCFLTPNLTSRRLAWGFWLAVALLLTVTQQWLTFAVAYGVPVLVFYSMIHYIRLTVEHKAPELAVMLHRDKRYVAESTDAVFLGEAPPVGYGVIAWTGWWFRLFFWHGLIRWLICPADVPVHDYHTRLAGNPREDWANAIWHRQAQQEAGCPGWPSLYTENWGFFRSMNSVFNSFSQLPGDYQF